MQVQSMGDLAVLSFSIYKKKFLQFLAEVVLEPGSSDPKSSALPIAPSEPLLKVVLLSMFIYVVCRNKANLKVIIIGAI